MLNEMLTPLFAMKNSREWALSLSVIMGILAFSTAFNSFFAWHDDFVLSHQKPLAANMRSMTDQTAQLIADIPTQHVFGHQASEDDDFLPITSLQYHLTGIVKTSSDHLSRAIISEANQTGKVYGIGDELVSGIKIHAINADGVILEHAGHLERLPLTRRALLFQAQPKSMWQDEE